MVKQFVIGTIAGTHGVKGDVKVFAECDDPERFRILKTVYIRHRGKVTKTTASNCRFAGKFVVIHLEGIEDMDAARLLHGAELLVDREDAPKLPEGRFYIPDLIGIRVEEEDGRVLGTFSDVIRTGANDVYVVRREDGTELLIPATKECILETRPEEGYMKVHLLPGLEDL
ncbi:MAG: ribosome maturation factor RimM [Lachnospiraceae bacterium]|jgi:16S rRNA processing protein RimM|nr:ribosome maturation factor RimM [Lachnospiraceae bacterium]MCI1397495.1 ribosome maturation factor RimM [Lachnospiraceae bacterium]MCI1423257.1 ribosome maturation factor RimM [Lachnospiraceae bacterium]MCI1452068.1 ribosome maturation factor RimM [Lachnospiraceae bacterium]MDD5848334.1 ribosome maturation factor RimM [Bacillota bacterium]